MNQKYNLKEITMLTFVRLDNEARIKNLQAMLGFYRKHCDNYTHIIVEDDTNPIVLSHIDLTPDDVYIFTKSTTEWKKCEGYNKGIKLAKTHNIVFNDVDAIIHPQQLLDTADALNKDPNAGLVYPYNGLFLCATDEMKDKFLVDYDYDVLDKRFPSQVADFTCIIDKDRTNFNEHVNKTYDDILIGHMYSKGGCVMGRRDNLIRCNGYNPLFLGWGYEDDEMPSRVNILGYNVGRIHGKGIPCWHLPHFDGTGSAKETQEFHEHNRLECAKVEKSSKEELQEYIKQWRL